MRLTFASGARAAPTVSAIAVLFGSVVTSALGCARPSEARFSANAASMGATGAAPQPLDAGNTRAPNVVGVNCDVGECQASCIVGSTILLAYGFHGRTYDSGGPVSNRCGEGVEWLGGCIGQESCAVKTPCTTSAMYLICR